MQDATPSVEDIMREIRKGLESQELTAESQASLDAYPSPYHDLKRATHAAPVMGRCGGSLRGKLCRWMAPLLHPVIEQLDLFHDAILAALKKTAAYFLVLDTLRQQVEALEAKVEKLEKTIDPNTTPPEKESQ